MLVCIRTVMGRMGDRVLDPVFSALNSRNATVFVHSGKLHVYEPNGLPSSNDDICSCPWMQERRPGLPRSHD